MSVEDCSGVSPIEKVVELFELADGQRTLSSEPRTIIGKGTVSFPVQLYRKYEMRVYNPENDLSYARQFDLSEEQYTRRNEKISWRPEPFYPTSLDMKVMAFDASSQKRLEGVAIEVTDAETGLQLEDLGNNVFRIEPNLTYNIFVRFEPKPNQELATAPPSRVLHYVPVDTAFRFSLSDQDKMRRLCGKISLEIPMKEQAPSLPLPIVLYFERDMPLRQQIRADQSRQSLYDAITQYLRRRNDYLENNEPSEARRVYAFFDREVSGGLATLDNLAESLLEYVDYMSQDEEVAIEIQGYCSPSGSSVYDDLLAKRRIHCVRTYLESYAKDGRKLGDYIGNKYILRELSLGATRSFSDDSFSSMWGISQALDNRVEVELNNR